MPTLLVLLTFSAMMPQTFAEASHTPCSHQRCDNGCPPLPIAQNSSQHDLISHSHPVACYCPPECLISTSIHPKNCTVQLSTQFLFVQHHDELKNPSNPCESFYCNDGYVSTRSPACAPVNCPLEHRIRLQGECCDICDTSFSTFCDGNHECDIACRYGFVHDPTADCDLCKCARLTTSTEATSSTTSMTTSSSAESEQKIFFFFFTSDSGLLNYVIVAVVLIAAIAFACFLAFIIWFLHRRIYNRVPLISHRSYKINEQYA